MDSISEIIEDIYYSMLGELIPEYTIPWVENAFAPGSKCHQEYTQAYDARLRIIDRLGLIDEDEDMEIILHAEMTIQKNLCFRMFTYGMEYQKILDSCNK